MAEPMATGAYEETLPSGQSRKWECRAQAVFLLFPFDSVWDPMPWNGASLPHPGFVLPSVNSKEQGSGSFNSPRPPLTGKPSSHWHYTMEQAFIM